MKLYSILFLGVLALGASADVHEEVQEALDWQLPSNPCKKPKAIRHLQRIDASGGYISHSPTNTTEESGGAPTVYGVDHYKISRYRRQKKRWESCISNYKSELLDNFERLKSSAQYGLTKPQANNIMSKLAQIQAVVLSPDGVINTGDAEPLSYSDESEK